MNQKAEALQHSIAHWERLLACESRGDVTSEGLYSESCALCDMYLHISQERWDEDEEEYAEMQCIGCPVSEASGQHLCECTPWRDVHDNYDKHNAFGKFSLAAHKEHAARELLFLKSLVEA